MVELKTYIDDIERYEPIAFVSGASIDFKKLYPHPTKRVINTQELRELVSYFLGVRNLEVPLAIEGLSFVRRESLSILLKLVEESSFPIILIFRYDKLTDALNSRIKTLVKYPAYETRSKLMEPIEYYKQFTDFQYNNHFEKINHLSENSPKVYAIQQKFNKIRNRDKAMRILS